MDGSLMLCDPGNALGSRVEGGWGGSLQGQGLSTDPSTPHRDSRLLCLEGFPCHSRDREGEGLAQGDTAQHWLPKHLLAQGLLSSPSPVGPGLSSLWTPAQSLPRLLRTLSLHCTLRRLPGQLPGSNAINGSTLPGRSSSNSLACHLRSRLPQTSLHTPSR